LIGWGVGQPLSLDFQPFEVGTIIISILLASFTISEGRSQWMAGALLIATYAIVAAGFALHSVEGEAASKKVC
jgi:Ca2+:H+ antiporter